MQCIVMYVLTKIDLKSFSYVSGIVDVAEKIAKTLNTDKANQTLLLEEAEEILKELVNRNFDAANMAMTEEQELVMVAINRAKSMLNDTMSLRSQLMEANKTLNELLGKFASILDKTSSVLENTSLALDTNNISRSYDSQVCPKVGMIVLCLFHLYASRLKLLKLYP